MSRKLLTLDHGELHTRLSRQLLRRFDPEKKEISKINLERVATGILLNPKLPAEQLSKTILLAEEAAKDDRDWNHFCLGLAKYRQGEFEAAKTSLSRADQSSNPNCRWSSAVVTAMIDNVSGDTVEASKQLDQLEIECFPTTAFSSDEIRDVPGAWHETHKWLLFNEAKQLIRGDVQASVESSSEERLTTIIDKALSQAEHPGLSTMRLAALALWLEDDERHEQICRLGLENAPMSEDPSEYERRAKALLIAPTDHDQLLQLATKFSKLSVKLGNGHQYFGYYKLVSGMAAYRNQNYQQAEDDLTEAMAGTNLLNRRIAQLFRAMTRFHVGDVAGAHADIQVCSSAGPRPKRDTLSAELIDHDSVFYWLAYDEATTLIGTDDDESP